MGASCCWVNIAAVDKKYAMLAWQVVEAMMKMQDTNGQHVVTDPRGANSGRRFQSVATQGKFQKYSGSSGASVKSGCDALQSLSIGFRTLV